MRSLFQLCVSAAIAHCAAIAALAESSVPPDSAADARHLRTEWWHGVFIQHAPLSWRGKMVLGIKFDPEGDYPQRSTAVVIWPDLGRATTEGELTMRDEREVEFSEERCLTGECHQKVLGGFFQGSISPSRDRLSGRAGGALGLSGEFDLQPLPHESVREGSPATPPNF